MMRNTSRLSFLHQQPHSFVQFHNFSINPQLQTLSLHKNVPNISQYHHQSILSSRYYSCFGQLSSPLFNPNSATHTNTKTNNTSSIINRNSKINSIIFNHSIRHGHSRTWGASNRIRAKKWKTWPPKRKSWVPQFEGAPQRKATVEQVLIKQPRKPNSGKRQVVKCRIKSNNKTLFAYIPFEKYALSKWNRVLLEGWSCSDVPFVHARCLRGKFDLPPPKLRGACRKHSRKGKPGKKTDRLKNSYQKQSILTLGKHVDKEVRVKFQGGREVVGILKGYDQLVNLVLDKTKEFIRDPNDPYTLTEATRELGLVVCRGSAVMLVCPQDGYEEIENPWVQQQAQQPII